MIYKLWGWLTRFLGLSGSWWWAYKQMRIGHVVYKMSDLCRIKYRLEIEAPYDILWAYESVLDSPEDRKWEVALIYDGDLTSRSWAIWRN